MIIPDRAHACWLSADWRTKTLLQLMEKYRLKAADVCDLTDTKLPTVYCWRKSVDRPISAIHLKILMFELDRGLV